MSGKERIAYCVMAMPLCLLLTFVFYLASAGTALAHGGGEAQVVNQPIGDYVMTIWQNPGLPEVGTVHLTVAVGQDNNPVLNQDVTVTAIPLSSDDEPIIAKATHENSTSRFLYEADLEIPKAGQWQFVTSVAGQAGTIAYETQIEAQSLLDRPITAIVAFSIIGVALVYGYWSGRKRG